MANDNANPLKCYVSSPTGVDTALLRKLLVALGAEPNAIEELPTAGEEYLPVLQNWIKRADFICAVLGDDPANVLFEIGLAMGMAKPVFLIAPDDDQIPNTLELLPHVRASLGEVDSIEFHLKAFVANIRARPVAKAAAAPLTTRPPRFYGGGPAIEIGNTPLPILEQQVEFEIIRLLQPIASNITRSARVGERYEADMIVWFLDPEISGGGPVPVEIKSRATSHFPAEAEHQLRQMLEAAHLRTGLLITGNPDPSLMARMRNGVIIFSISFAGLREEIARNSFASSLRQTRNRLFHGMT